MYNIVKKYLWRKTYELNTLGRSSDGFYKNNYSYYSNYSILAITQANKHSLNTLMMEAYFCKSLIADVLRQSWNSLPHTRLLWNLTYEKVC